MILTFILGVITALFIVFSLFKKTIRKLLSIKITQFPEKQRGKISERVKGRVSELRELKKIIRQSRLKDMSKAYWRESSKDGEFK